MWEGSSRNLGDPVVVVCEAGTVHGNPTDPACAECLRCAGANREATHEARVRIHKRAGAGGGKS